MKVVDKIDEICNYLGGPVASYAYTYAMREYEERIQRAVNDLQDIKKQLKRKRR